MAVKDVEVAYRELADPGRSRRGIRSSPLVLTLLGGSCHLRTNSCPGYRILDAYVAGSPRCPQDVIGPMPIQLRFFGFFLWRERDQVSGKGPNRINVCRVTLVRVRSCRGGRSPECLKVVMWLARGESGAGAGDDLLPDPLGPFGEERVEAHPAGALPAEFQAAPGQGEGRTG